MKKLATIFLILALAYGSHAQDLNSASYMNTILQGAVQKMESNNGNVVHAETGIVTINSSLNGDYTTRELYAGNTYTITVFTDTRVPNFKLLIWKKNAANDWERFDSVDENNHTKLGLEAIGDKEVIRIKPLENKDYAIQLFSQSSGNKTGRYGVIIVADKNATQTGTGTGNGGTTTPTTTTPSTSSANKKTFMSCDYYSFTYLKKDNNDKWALDGDWERTDESSLFMLNPAETMFEHTTPAMKSTYYVQSKSNDGKVFSFEVKSDVGNSYTFDLNLKEDKLDIFGKDAKGRWFVKRLHFKRVWTE